MQIKIVAFKWRVKGRAAAHTRAINWKIKAEQGGVRGAGEDSARLEIIIPIPRTEKALSMLKANQVKSVYCTRRSRPPHAACNNLAKQRRCPR